MMPNTSNTSILINSKTIFQSKDESIASIKEKTKSDMYIKSSFTKGFITATSKAENPLIHKMNNWLHLSKNPLKIFAFLTMMLFLFSSCKKDDFMPPAKDAGSNLGMYKASGLTYYIDPKGNDTTGNGSISYPWRSLFKATTSVKSSGRMIHVNSGTYLEVRECPLSVGVSIEGAGISSVLRMTRVVSRVGGTANGSISLVSASQGTNGNQTISNLKLDGINKGTVGIVVGRRSNVKIHDITIMNFKYNGITFNGGASQYTTPTTFATGNEIYNITGIDCGTVPVTQDDYSNWTNGGLIAFSGQDGFKMYSNSLTNTGHTPNGNDNTLCIGYPNKGSKIYSNVSTKLTNDAGWNFHFEFWNSWGGVEIYNNDFYGGKNALDLSGNVASFKGDYDYSYSVHDNRFYNTGAKTTSGRYMITIEGISTCDILIYSNYFLDCPCPIAISEGSFNNNPIVASELRNIRIYQNVMERCGYNNAGLWSNVISLNNSAVGSKMSDIHINNNVIISDITRNCGIKINIGGSGAKAQNINIKNNVIQGMTNGTFLNVVNRGSIAGLNVDNNCLYLNSNSNNPTFTGNAVTGYTFLKNVKANPLFISKTDFHIQPTSPAKDAGINVGLPYLSSAPDIGVFEYGNEVAAPISPNQSPLIQNQSLQLNAGSAVNTVAGKIVASDSDAGQTLTYSIISGNTSGAFTINASTGVLSVNNSSALNINTNPSFSLIVKVQDNGTGNLSNQSTITVYLNSVVNSSATGKITYQKWNNLGTSISVTALTGNINYPNNPSSKTLISSMEAVPGQGENYGARIAGYIIAPATGSYTFWIASDDYGELWLSTNDQPANKKKIAYHTSYTNSRQWNKFPTQKSVAINLVKGQKYFIEALMKEATGGDNLAVAWQKPGQSGIWPSEVIPGSVLSAN